MNEPKADNVSSLSVQEAKEVAQSTEAQIAAFIPERYVERNHQSPDGVLMNCSEPETYSWTGETVVYLKGQPDIEAVLAQVESHWEDQTGFQVERRTARDGTPEVDISGRYGAGYLVGPYPDGVRFLITSFSPCFRVPEGFDTGGTY